jgi:hypothetical protein
MVPRIVGAGESELSVKCRGRGIEAGEMFLVPA